jgi:hypothetical protein
MIVGVQAKDIGVFFGHGYSSRRGSSGGIVAIKTHIDFKLQA